MLTSEKIENLVNLGYCIQYGNERLFKTIQYNGANQYSSIFIEIATEEISFEGIATGRKELLQEIKGVIGKDTLSTPKMQSID